MNELLAFLLFLGIVLVIIFWGFGITPAMVLAALVSLL